MHGGITHVSAVIKRRPRTTRAGQGTEEPLLALLAALQAVEAGDFSVQLPAHWAGRRRLQGEFLRSARLMNSMIEQISEFSSEVTRVALEVGIEGKLGGQAQVPGVAGTGKDLTENVNPLATNLTNQVHAIADVAPAVARGDLTRTITVDVRGEVAELRDNINSMIQTPGAPERLLDETALFPHRVIADLPPAQQRMVQRLHESDDAIRNKRVLVVDDDVRTIFALSSVLERHGMEVVTASNGQEAIDRVASDPTIGLVLMDIMTPGMDGYDAIRAIREKPESRSLPIVALTAKAMKGDREKCLEAGASDYLAKPAVTDQLLGVLLDILPRLKSGDSYGAHPGIEPE